MIFARRVAVSPCRADGNGRGIKAANEVTWTATTIFSPRRFRKSL
jgi:hypothetical protein